MNNNTVPRLAVILDVERALSHHLAHDLNNALGAVDVLAEMIGDDVRAVSSYIPKIRLAAQMARTQVQALRQAVPRCGDGTTTIRFTDGWRAAVLMMGGESSVMGARCHVTGADDVMVHAPAAVMTYVLYYVLTHVAGCSAGPVICHVADVDGSQATLHITGKGDMIQPSWPHPLWGDVIDTFGIQLTSMPDGFVLQCPCAPV